MVKERYIIHIDMDAFFAAVEQRDNLSLRGKPVVIGADPKSGKGRGVVSTCSYEARRFGIHSAMPISEAYRRCPDAVFLQGDYKKYTRISEQIFRLLYDFTPDIEPVGIDEAFLDITGSYKLFGSPDKVCRLIKERVKKEVGLTASIGLAPTKMAAKIASDLKKPDGLVEVRPDRLLEFLRPLDVGRIWGLGKKGKVILNSVGIRTIGELARMEPDRLVKLFGRNGIELHKLANGIDEREVETELDAKSISNELTFDVDTGDKALVKSAISGLSEKVSHRLRTAGLKCRTIGIKIRLTGFETYTRAVTVDKPTNFFDVIYKEAVRLYENFRTGNKKIRLIGVRTSNLTTGDIQETLFKDKVDEKQEAVHKAIDKLKSKFGDGAVGRAASGLP